MSKSSLGRDAMEAARRIARKQFRHHPDRETLVKDAEHTAWELAQTASPDATAGFLGIFAVRRCRQGRQFKQSIRSIDSAKTADSGREAERPARDGLNPATLYSEAADPARIVAFRLDIRAWFETLTERQQEAALMLARGEKPVDVAEFFGISRAAVSILQRRLADLWQAFQE